MKKLLIIFGGKSNEHEVSCISAQNIINFIDNKKYTYETILIDKEGNWLKNNDQKIENIFEFLKQFDVVFPVLHGKYGEDGKLQGLLDMAEVKYVGSSILASAVGMDKHFSKIICENLGIPTLPYYVINGPYKIKEIEKKLKYPLIIKPANSGSSIGIYVAQNKKELKEKIDLAKNVDKKIIIEPFVKVRELECAILQGKKLIVSKVGEITHHSEFYDYNAKYQNENTQIIIPANIDRKIAKKIQKYARNFFIGIEAKGLARIDFFLDENNNIYFNEINTMPGFTNQSMYPKLLKNLGFTQKEIISTLIDYA